MHYQVVELDGSLLDAHFQVEGNSIWFLSRGGTKGASGINADYGPALKLLLERLKHAAVSLDGIWVDSSSVQGIPLADRRILSPGEWSSGPDDVFTLISRRMKSIGQKAGTATGGNSTRKLRIDIEAHMPEQGIVQVLGGVPSSRNLRSLDRLPADLLRKVTAKHVWSAVQQVIGGHALEPYGPSTDFDLIADDGKRLPPKAVFGIAASDALGFQVLPGHFSAGIGTPCFRILTESGYSIVAKDAAAPTVSVPPNNEDDTWAEGNLKLVTHLRRERAKGAAQAKKVEFKAQHGVLRCERCHMVPTKQYGEFGEACIEVHHRDTQVKDMASNHVTTLDELQCLCANCHRIVHRELKLMHVKLAPYSEEE